MDMHKINIGLFLNVFSERAIRYTIYILYMRIGVNDFLDGFVLISTLPTLPLIFPFHYV